MKRAGTRIALGAAVGAALCAAAAAGVAGCRRPAPPAPRAIAGFPPPRIVTDVERYAYVGSSVCIGCHPQLAGQLATHHARTLAKVGSLDARERFCRPSDVRDPVLGVTYRATVHAGRCLVTATKNGRTWSAAPEFAFGSGEHGVTYVGRYEGTPVEMRISYYSQPRRWDYTPSQQPGSHAAAANPVGRSLVFTTLAGCFGCHTTATVARAPEIDTERSIFGVSCESCHGPGRAHVEAVRSGSADLRMARLSSIRSRVSLELCGECHRTPEANDPHNPMTHSQLARLQGLALGMSACFKKSHGALSCISCHDPHRDADRTSHATYDAVCASCHAAGPAGHVVCPRAPAGDCISCHMPREKVDVPTGLTYRNHWIKVWK